MGHSKCNPAPVSLDTDVEIQHYGNDQDNSVSHDTKGKILCMEFYIPNITWIKIHALKKKSGKFY